MYESTILLRAVERWVGGARAPIAQDGKFVFVTPELYTTPVVSKQ